jgi:type IV pilus assembly protein PilC
MQNFRYKITTASGQIEEGIVKAVSSADAALQIRRPEWFILYVRPDQPLGFFTSLGKKYSRLTSMERIIFTDHMAAMIESGTPMMEALETYKEDETRKIESIITEIVSDLQQGQKLSEAMAKFPKQFTPFYVSLISAGELTGRLDETLWYLAAELRREHEFKERIKSAMIYPMLVLTVALIVVTLLVTLVMPKLTELIRSFGTDIPLATKLVFFVSEGLLKYSPLIAVFALGLATAIFFALKSPKMKVRIDEKILDLPLIGQIQKKYILARMLRILGSSLKYGIPLPDGLINVTDVVGNARYKAAMVRIGKKISRGQTISASMSAEGYDLFPTTVIRSLKGAEKTGTMDAAMLRLSNFYEAEVDRLLKRLTDLIEPAMVIILGVIVGAIAIGVVMPIYQLTGKIK